MARKNEKGNYDWKFAPPYSHMIIHFHVKLHLPASEIPIIIDPNEVSGSAWLNPDDLINAFYS